MMPINPRAPFERRRPSRISTAMTRIFHPLLQATILIGLTGQPTASAEVGGHGTQSQGTGEPLLAQTESPERVDGSARPTAEEGRPERVRRLEEDMTPAQGPETKDSGPSWLDRVEFSALIEVEASRTRPFEGPTESDLLLATLELGIRASINEWVSIEITGLYEEDETDPEIDVATVTLENPDVTPLFLIAGQMYIPFGTYETSLVSDPLTLELGEARETAIQLGFASDAFFGSLYAFSGDNEVDEEREIGDWGASLGYRKEVDGSAFTFALGYLSDLGDSDAIQEVVAENLEAARDAAVEEGEDPADFSLSPSRRTGGWTASASARLGDLSLIAEYLTATGAFEARSLEYRGKGARPSAWSIELGYDFEVMGRDSTAAISYQGTKEALGMELPKERLLLGLSVEVLDNTSLSLEWAHDWDYARADGGSGRTADTLTAQLSVEI